MKAVLLTLLFLVVVAFGESEEPTFEPSDDFSPGLFFAAVIGIAVVLVLIGTGAVLTAVVVASLSVLVALGIVSSSALVGILRRRLSSGFRALHYQCFAVLALPCGMGLLWLRARFFHSHLSDGSILAVGAIAGVCGGLGFAFALDRLACVACRRFLAATNPG